MKNIFKFSLHALILILIIFGSFNNFALAENDQRFDDDETFLIPCGQEKAGPKDSDENGNPIPEGAPLHPCNAEHFIIMVNRVIEFVLIYLVLPIAAIMFAYAGAKLMFSGGDTEARSQAKALFWNIVKGVLFIAGAWLIVTTILSVLGYTGSTILK